jgi:hypothetical protein
VPGELAGTLIGVAASQDAKLRPAYRLLRTAYEDTVARSRTRADILGLLGFLATLLAAIGLAGLTGYTVSQRTREIGVRIALGSGRTRIVRAVIRPWFFLSQLELYPECLSPAQSLLCFEITFPACVPPIPLLISWQSFCSFSSFSSLYLYL